MKKPEFKSFPKIPHFKHLHCVVTQKIHGTNAAVEVYEVPCESGVGMNREVIAQSRTRHIFPGDDNYGFAAWVAANRDALIGLGVGIHYGEWAGPGINSGEGLAERTFVLFDYWRYKDMALPNQVQLVPVLYSGPLDPAAIEAADEDLRTNGSKLAPGFMRPEGVVITVANQRYKAPFDDEQTSWKRGSGVKVLGSRASTVNVDHLLQPLRLEKLLSRDERYRRDFPTTLPDICRDYVADLEAEGVLHDVDSGVRKSLGREMFGFVKQHVGGSV